MNCSEVEIPLIIVHLEHGNALTAKNVADKQSLPFPLDFPVAADDPDLERHRVINRRHSRGIGSSIRLHSGDRTLLTERLVRSNVVELFNEDVEPPLLGAHVWFWWLGRVVLERPVHAFVDPILLRPAWFNAHVLNAQLDPHLRQFGDPAKSARCTKRRPVVGDHLLGQAPPSEEDRKSTRLNSSHRTISYAVFCLKKKK